MSQPRVHSIDVLKTLAIVTVVWIHSFPLRFVGDVDLVRYGMRIAAFAVPAFFFASGFLAAHMPRVGMRAFVSTRLPRLLAPYLMASVLALALRILVLDEPYSSGRIILALLFGDAFGLYYFVPVLVIGTAALDLALLRRPRWLAVWAAVFLAIGFAHEASLLYPQRFTPAPWFWGLRNPLRWFGYLAFGAAIGHAWPGIMRWPLGHARRVGLTCLGIAALATLTAWLAPTPHLMRTATGGIMIALAPAIVFLARDAHPSPMIARVSDATYAIYLYHYFPIHVLTTLSLPPVTRGLIAWPLGLAFGILVGLGARRLLGRRARLITG